MKKSYHSIVVPIPPASATRRAPRAVRLVSVDGSGVAIGGYCVPNLESRIPNPESRARVPSPGSTAYTDRFRREIAVMSRPRSAHGYRLWFVLAALGTVTFGIHARAGQQKVEFRGGIPVAPSGLAGHKLPAQPVEFDTGEGQRIRVSAVTRALEYPWALA